MLDCFFLQHSAAIKRGPMRQAERMRGGGGGVACIPGCCGVHDLWPDVIV